MTVDVQEVTLVGAVGYVAIVIGLVTEIAVDMMNS